MKHWKMKEYQLEGRLQLLGHDAERQWLSRGPYGDVHDKTHKVIYDVKTSLKSAKSMSITFEDVEKIHNEAAALPGYIGAIYFSFYGRRKNTNYVIIPLDVFLNLKNKTMLWEKLLKDKIASVTDNATTI
jgi:hypothetical protein